MASVLAPVGRAEERVRFCAEEDAPVVDHGEDGGVHTAFRQGLDQRVERRRVEIGRRRELGPDARPLPSPCSRAAEP